MTISNRTYMLSKSRFVAGLQCLKRLYYQVRQPDLAEPFDEVQQARLDSGTDVGKLARKMYPGGVLVDSDHEHFQQALGRTKGLIDSGSWPALFEPAFLFNQVRARADILSRLAGGGFSLVEVKSSTQVKDEYLPDAAIQFYVMAGAGLDMRTAAIAHLNRDYVYPGGEYDLKRLFTIADIIDPVRNYLDEIPDQLAQMKQVVSADEPPAIGIGRQCESPVTCEFHRHCHQYEPLYPVSELHRASAGLVLALREAGFRDIRQIPRDFPGISRVHELQRQCLLKNAWHLSASLPRELRNLEYPVHFLDFESFSPALPVYAGTRPYEAVTFQWSDHVLMKDGSLGHKEFLADGHSDPREAFVSSLVEALGTAGSIVVYSSYEQTRIDALARAYPGSATQLQAIKPRLFDLHAAVRQDCYHPDFHGSFSIKSVLPALVPDLGYDDLEIRDGGQAMLRFGEMIRPETTGDRRLQIRRDLLAYCERDTLAMVRLVEVLKGGKLPQPQGV
jgi:hypothetical protein